MILIGLQEFKIDPSDYYQCIFLGENIIFIVYVNDCLLFSKKEKFIDALVEQMRHHKFELKYEDQSINCFLGLDITMTGTGNNKNIMFKMAHRIDRLLVLAGMTGCTPKDTPSIQTPLCSDIYGAPHKEYDKWNYAATVVILQYLSRNDRPGTELAVNQVVCHTHNPKLSHDIAIKRICRYLKGTRDEGLIFKPNEILNMVCYIDADFAGIWHVKNTK